MPFCPQCGKQYPSGTQRCAEDDAPLRADSTSVGVALPQQLEVEQDKLVGRILDDKYRLDARLGEGGMGTVYRATHLLIERPVAVKVLHTKLVGDEAAKERFRREARAAGRLQHSNAVAVTDFGETTDGIVYIVMELLEGISLREVLALGAPLDAARAASLTLQISAAVSAAHEAGIIHRDLKPGNIVVIQRAHNAPIVKVLDFGIAKLAVAHGEEGMQTSGTLTDTGVMIGTPRYMSPEQCDGARLTPASDVYSLGIILYEMLTGTTPFTGPTPLAVALKHSSEPPRPPRDIVPSIPPALEELILKALQKDASTRQQDAGEFRRELHSVVEHLGLEQAAGFSQPTMEMLHDVGTQTPSGRLVIDLDKLRKQRAETLQGNIAAETAQEIAPDTDAGLARRQLASQQEINQSNARGALTVDGQIKSTHRDATDGSHAPGVTNAIDRFRYWLAGDSRRALYAAGIAALAVLLLVVLLSAIRSARSGSTGANSNVNRNANTEPGEAVGKTLNAEELGARNVNAPARQPETAAEFDQRAIYYFAQRDYENAIRDYRRALELEPGSAAINNRLGQALLVKGQYAEAAEAFRTAVKLRDGNFPAAQYNLGYALQQNRDFYNAISAYNEAINNGGGTYADAFYQLGSIHYEMGRDREAIDAFKKAIEQYGGRDADSNNALGAAYARQKQLAEAEAAFRRATEERADGFPDAHYNLGLLYENNNRLADAVREYETYLRLRPDAYNRQLVERDLRQLRRRAARETGNQNQ